MMVVLTTIVMLALFYRSWVWRQRAKQLREAYGLRRSHHWQ